MSSPFRILLPGMALLCAATASAADFRDDIDFTKLKAEYGSSLPDGSGVRMAQTEYMRDGHWAPEASGELAGKTFNYITDIFGGYSGHAYEVGCYLGGSATSITPALPGWTCFEATNYCAQQSLMAGRSGPPLVATWDIENHSWGGNDMLNGITNLQREDYRIERDKVVVVVGVDNGGGPLSMMMANAYNVISVGSSTGDHPHGGSTLEVLGRMKPELVGTATWTSYATPIVASCATLLVGEINRSPALAPARNPLAIKALLMAGATKDEFPGWQHTPTRPIDVIYGAGEVNIYNSYKALIAGRQQPSASTTVGSDGWDVNTTSLSTRRLYYLSVPAGQTLTLSAVLTWNCHVQPDSVWQAPVSVVNNLDLTLWNADSGRNLQGKVYGSISAIDNFEHVYEKTLAAGMYALEVVAPLDGETYGLAWKGTLSGAASNAAPVIASLAVNPTQVTLPSGAAVTVGASDPDGDALSYAWSTLSGPANAGFAAPTAASSAVSFPAAGTYSLQIQVGDGHGHVVTRSVSVAVQNGSSGPAFANAGFENPNVGANTFAAFAYGPTGAGWTFTSAGVSGNNSGFTEQNPAAPEGGQVAFLQMTGSISQTVGLPAGTWTVGFQAAQRVNWQQSAEDFQVLVDGAPVGTFTPAGSSYAAYVSAPFTVAAGTHEVRFTGLDSRGGDNTAFIDDVRIVAGSPASGGTLIDSTDDHLGTITARGENGTAEGRLMAFDNASASKWLDFSPSGSWIQYRYAGSQQYSVSQYTITSANDAVERDPCDWQLLGSNDGGGSWTTVDSRTGIAFDARLQKLQFIAANPGAYNIYRLNITRVQNPAAANSVQLSEIELLAPSGASDPILANAGFEAPPVGSNTWGAFIGAPTGAGWTFTGNSGISGNGSGYTDGNPGAPQGAQVGILQMTGTIRQSTTFAAGSYQVVFSAAQRANYQMSSQDFQLWIDSQLVGTWRPTGSGYSTLRSATFSVGAGSHEVRFVGLDSNGGDNTVFLDDVQIEVAAPSSSG